MQNGNNFEIEEHAQTYYIQTFGCQMNERDTEILAGMLEQLSYSPSASIEKADIILINTCCIREKAESKALSQIGELKKFKNNNPHLIIGVCGCMAQQEEKAKEIMRSLPYVDFILGTHNIHELPDVVKKIWAEKQNYVLVWDQEKEIIENLPYKNKFSYKALVNITYGCNNFCTYCIVPYVRGRERSRQSEYILKEIRDMVNDGVVEIMLLGQNVNSYGKDFTEIEYDFSDLISDINEIEGLKRIRYMTSHPRDFNLKLIKTIAKCEKVCQHFHLPVQAGSDKILAKMNRGYTQETYLKLVDNIRKFNPNATITTDIIVGFPGETDEDFLETLNLVKKVKFDSAYTFVYSPRKGTPAANFPDQIPLAIKKERLQTLNQIINEHSREKSEQYLNKVYEVLVEGHSKNNDQMLSGRTESAKNVIFSGDDELIGKIVPVLITEAQTWILKGELQ
ncbi:tRNA-i(6)A37 thiotransferase enzyme MiaB [Desulfonispora thiosulfatigenes DSM 11270]|uniref:tRNA-2-methylthio-N(6)-dimethylallyladenosine synthase n=1 Tax=Desulfonispora thiosulfatigenes DSM 11270 TaxID=656914 RepID=A0A1W1VP17_DESTI|nr:tRNA (N6-isopentenyl adenosine(37)-C2)-methylthiotransferase MiaB [Desulfonispora thiosulfatigenes]SMB95066.1 tRNA-i(6)A37 thiotransferase enzyme MiaB [Desulfonispora thiosulfatigenes DSM 11270]